MPTKRVAEPVSPPQTPKRGRKRPCFRTGSTSSPSSPSKPFNSPKSEQSRPSSSLSAASLFSISYSVPSDSPTNPFGLERVKDVCLPPITSYARHVALRLQVVCPEIAARPSALQSQRGPFTAKSRPSYVPASRIVQIPLNYSFRLLHAVVHYLFSADVPPTSKTENSTTPLNTMPPSASRHRFEIYTQVECGETNKNEGVIEVGRMVAQLSEDSENESGAADLSITPEQAEETSQTWTWWDEEHSKLAFLYPKGPDLSRGIIYRPDPDGFPDLSIHITVNTRKLPSRRGTGNLPHVFSVDGYIPRSLSALLGPPPALPPLPKSKRSQPPPLGRARTVVSSKPDPLQTWNQEDVFKRFVDGLNNRTRIALREASRSRESPSPGSDPGNASDSEGDLEVPFASSPVGPRTLKEREDGSYASQSIVQRRRSFGDLRDDEDSDDEDEAASAPITRPRSLSADWLYHGVPLFTPAPAPGSLLDRRIGAAGQRIKRISAIGLDWFDDSDEEEKAKNEAEDQPGKGAVSVAPSSKDGKPHVKAVEEHIRAPPPKVVKVANGVADYTPERGRSPTKRRRPPNRAASEEV